MNTLNNYKTISGTLLKEWDEKKIDKIKTHLYYLIKINLEQDKINYTAGTIPQPYENIHFYNAEKLENLFGLPYISSEDFAGIWNTNTQAETKWGELLKFRGATYTEEGEGVLIFEDNEAMLYYFNEYEFVEYIEQEKEKQRARDIAEFNANINKSLSEIRQIIDKFTGKKYGEKTKEKISTELKTIMKKYNFNIYLDTNRYKNQYINFYKNITGGQIEKSILFDFLDNNTIQQAEPHKIDEPNTLQALKENKNAKNKIQRKAAELLELVEKYNKNLQILEKDSREISNLRTDLYSVAKYGLKD